MAITSRLVQAVRISSRAIWTKVCELVSSTGDLGAIAAVRGAGRLWPPTASLVVLALSVLSAVAAQSQQSFTVTVTLTASPSTNVYAGEVVTLTATALVNGGSCFLCGQELQFMDASVQPHLIGKATPAPNGNNTTASVKVRFGAGTHSITAYLPNNGYNSNTYSSAATVLTVRPPLTPYSTATTIGSAGTPGDYTLTGTTTGEGLGAPTGTISFEDASNSNSVLGSGALGSRSGYFATGVLGGATVSTPGSMVVGDFNNDGYPDLAVLNIGSSTLSIYLNNGNGTFANPQSFAAPSAEFIVAGDPLGRGILDLFLGASNGSGQDIVWFQGNGSGGFNLSALQQLNHPPSQLILGCGPGQWDASICSVSQSSGIVEMYYMNTNPGFYPVSSLNGVSGDYYAAGGVTGNAILADFSQNGILDLAYGNTSSQIVVVYPVNGATVTTTSVLSWTGAPPVGMVAGDFNNDGYPDIAVVTQNNGLWIILNNGNGGFATPVSAYALPYPGPVVTGDFNSDGNLDLAIQQSGAHPILILYGNGRGGFSAAPQASVSTGFSSNVGTLAIADLNGDGLLDLITSPGTGSSTQSFSVMFAEQTETASASSLFAYGDGVHNADAVYATMIFVAVWTGLRVSELIGLKWRCIHADSITVEQRYFRGDWSVPKTDASAATIGVDPEVIARLLRLTTLTVEVRAGFAVRKHKLVKSGGPDDLVFQSVQAGKPMNDQNVLKRHLKPAARKLGLSFVNWQCLRTSHATWLVQAGADPKSVQGQMRHSRISTTMEIYAQIVPSAQRRALQQLSAFASGGGQPAAHQPMDLDLDFSEPTDETDPRSNSRSKTFQIN